MSKDANQPRTCGCGPSITSLRMLTLPDGLTVGVTGLDEIFQDMRQSKKKPDADTAREIVNRLEKKNYIPPRAREQYQRAVLEEYKKFGYRGVKD
ncbi:MAG: hypothetical protein ACE5K3_01740 [bacterium]